jgi:diguanylate cyclase (GGDEF)-like protein
LPNRSLFLERLQHEIKHAARTGLPVGLLFIDLDDFKKVNDRLGHPAGDQLLQQVAMRISKCVRNTDTVARLGGDEFTVILTDVTNTTNIETIAAEIVDALCRPFTLTAGEATISASMGVALYPRDCNTPAGLVSKADEAMYASKNAGRNQYRLANIDIPDDVTPNS